MCRSSLRGYASSIAGKRVIVRQSLDAPLSQARYWASSDLEASPEMLLVHIATRLRHRSPLWRWQGRIGLGSLSTDERDGHCVLVVRWRCWPMSSWRKNATACKCSGNVLLPSGRRGVRSSVAIDGICSAGFMNSSNPAWSLTPCMNSSQPERRRPKSANIET